MNGRLIAKYVCIVIAVGCLGAYEVAACFTPPHWAMSQRNRWWAKMRWWLVRDDLNARPMQAPSTYG